MAMVAGRGDDSRIDRVRRVGLAVLLFSTATASVVAQGVPQPDETLPGFKATQLYSTFGSDHINVFSGDPGIVIPLGPEYQLSSGLSWQLKAYYSAKFWHLFQGLCRDLSPCGGEQTASRGQVNGYPTLGVGWTLELGYVTGSYNSVTDQGHGVYVSPDGQSHPWVIAGTSGSAVTSDGSQLRISQLPDQTFLVYEPDGTIRSFAHPYLRPIPVNGFDFSSDDRNGGNPRFVRYGLSWIIDRFGKIVLSVNYQQSYPSEGAWKVSSVTLPGGRPINFTWGIYGTSDGPWDVLVAVDFPVPAPASTLHVAFSYLQPPSATLLRTLWDTGGSITCVPAGPRTTTLPFLESITQFSQTHSFEYLLTLDVNLPNGVLNAMTLPTGGRIEYEYSLSTAPPPVAVENFGNPELTGFTAALNRAGASRQPAAYDDCSADAVFQMYLDTTPAVVTRRERASAGGAIISEVRYFRDQFGSRDLPADRFVDPERVVRRVVITRPDGNGSRVATKVIFHATPYRNPMEVSRREYGSLDTGGTPLRSVITCYDQYANDVGNGCGVAAPDGRIQDFSEILFERRAKTVTWFGANPAPAGGDCADGSTPCWQRAMSGYNSTAFEFETETLSSNSQTLLYQMDSHTATKHWTPFVDASHWVLKLFDSKTVSDNYTSVPCPWQPCSVRTDYDFNSQNGFLNTYSITDPTYGTLRRAFQDDGSGNPGLEVLSGDSTSGSVSGFLVTRRSFANGLVLTSQRDLNGLATAYGYDPLGRLTSITPPAGEAATTYCYADWSAQNPSQAAFVLAKKGAASSCSTDDGLPGAGSGSLEAYQFDVLGRLQREVRRLPNPLSTGSYLSFQEIRYDTAGHRSFLSEWTPCATSYGPTDVRSCFGTSASSGTTWSNFDFVGRARQVVVADGGLTTHSYDDPAGVSNSDFVDLETQTRSYTSPTGQAVTGPLTRGFRKDILGRTLLVAEWGPPPYGPVTAYQYDAMGRLTFVNLAGTSVQNRYFVYDLFGFLRSETHPEKGTTTYSSYNAMGKLLSSTEPDGTFISRTYDTAGRLLSLTGAGQLYAENAYDGSCNPAATLPPFSCGKLTHRVGHNPLASSPMDVIEDFGYSGLGGRLSDKSTSFGSGSLAPLTEHWFYDSMGQVAQYDHPRPTGASPFAVSTSYSAGLPVLEYVNGIPAVKGVTYNPAGAPATYVTGIGVGHDVTTTITQDSSLLPRPSSITAVEQASGAALLATGGYGYDPAGNVTAMGADGFTYDAMSRLTTASLAGAGSQSYTYDVYGNMLSKAGVGFGVNAATNRAGFPYTYDGRGNVVGTLAYTYTYDALDRQVTHSDGTSLWTYLFAGDNERLVRVLPASLGQPVYTLRDDDKRVVSEFVGGSVSRDNVFLGRQLVVSFANTAVNGSVVAWHFYCADHLGTPRLDTGVAGNVLDTRKYWPFGESVAPPQSNQRIRFAGMEVDTEAGSRYYDHARSHDGGLGRFLSPDPLKGQVSRPQSWNRYAYALNRPLTMVDSTGGEGDEVWAHLRNMVSEASMNVVKKIPQVAKGEPAPDALREAVRDAAKQTAKDEAKKLGHSLLDKAEAAAKASRDLSVEPGGGYNPSPVAVQTVQLQPPPKDASLEEKAGYKLVEYTTDKASLNKANEGATTFNQIVRIVGDWMTGWVESKPPLNRAFRHTRDEEKVIDGE
jgi:RHS repeat-associated protein